MCLTLLASLVALTAVALTAAEPNGYYRQPAVHGQVLVFAAEGDLWRVAATGGVATRLTTHPDAESRPAIFSSLSAFHVSFQESHHLFHYIRGFQKMG